MKTTINIDDNYKVEVDEYNHTLLKFSPGGEEITKGKFAGQFTKEKWEVVGYYPNLNQVLRKVVFLESLGGDCSLVEYVGRLEMLDKKYEGVK